MSDKDIKKATRHVNQNEGLIFERSSPGKKGYRLPPLDVPAVDHKKALGGAAREDLGNMPEVSEMEIIRHFTRLSTWNYAIDLGMYPLGSCTMKYNARVNEFVVRLRGLAEAHPYQPERISQGAMRVMKTLADCLLDITGMDAITLQPAAGAHGEMTGILLIAAYHAAKGNKAKKKYVVVPDSSHGTNPASAAIAGYEIITVPTAPYGDMDMELFKKAMNDEVAAVMMTCPNTLGLF
ncbi:MAG TPA: hypothetical protein VLT16_03510, partial [Candidatus Limnocylindrales bacterium]|nr:hypothetical protein [Candidatus Limnocylindrales bacterium]